MGEVLINDESVIDDNDSEEESFNDEEDETTLTDIVLSIESFNLLIVQEIVFTSISEEDT